MRSRSRNRGYSRGAASTSDPLAAYLATISSLQAWWDPASDAYFTFSTGAQISAWVSRMGALGAKTLAQATSGNQPTRALAVSVLGNKNAVLLDGTDDFLAASTAADWAFLHNNTGACIISVERIDSTGVAIQYPYSTCANSAANVGIFHAASTTNLTMRVANGSGTFQNNWSSTTLAHYERDVSRWRAWSYGSGTQSSHVSGSSVTNADTGGQTPSVAAPQNAFTVGRSSGGASTSFKGYMGDIMVFNEVPSATVRNNIAALLAQKYPGSVTA